LLLLFGVRPLLKRLKQPEADDEGEDDDEVGEEEEDEEDGAAKEGGITAGAPPNVASQVELARQLATSQPDRAVAALQRMLASPPPALPTDEPEEEPA
jgi:flagellar M-ring protein FliF